MLLIQCCYGGISIYSPSFGLAEDVMTALRTSEIFGWLLFDPSSLASELDSVVVSPISLTLYGLC